MPKELMYIVARRKFAKENFISTGMLQRYLQISYSAARSILDNFIDEGFCEPQIGAWPCRRIIIKYQN